MKKIVTSILLAVFCATGFGAYEFVFDGVTYSGGSYYYSNDYFTGTMCLGSNDPFLYYCDSYDNQSWYIGHGSLVRVRRDLTGTVTVQAKVNRQSNGYTDVNIWTVQAYAFKDCTNITEIIISEGVTSIGVGAFANCTSLKKITLPSTVETLGANIFTGCHNLEEVSIPYENRKFKAEGSLLLSIDGKTVMGVLTKNPSVSIPATVTSLSAGAFGGCENVEVMFEGLPPEGFSTAGISNCRMVYYKEEYADEWLEMIQKSGQTFSNVTMLAQTPAGFVKRAFSGYADVAERGGAFGVTLRAGIPATVSIPDNLGDIYIDLAGYNITGKPAVAIVPTEGDGTATRLFFSDSNPDDSVDIKGEDGVGYERRADPSYPAIHVKPECRSGVVVSVGKNVEIEGGRWGLTDLERGTEPPSPAVIGNVGYNFGSLTSGGGGLGTYSVAVSGAVWVNEGIIKGNIDDGRMDSGITELAVNEGGSLAVDLTEDDFLEAVTNNANSISCVYDGLSHFVQVPASETFCSEVAYSLRREGPYSQSVIEFTAVTNVVVWYVHSSPICGPAVTNAALISITPKALSTDWVGELGDIVGNGVDGVTPVPVVTDPVLGQLVAGRDFVLSYENNVAMGVAKVTVVGIGNYGGDASRNFNIVGLSDPSWTATLRSDKKVVINKAGSDLSGDVVVPSTLQGYEVVEISARAFEGRTDVTSITIPTNVQAIGDCAFANCPNLTRITVNTPPSQGMSTYAFGGVAEILDVPDNLKARWNKYIFEIPSAVEVKSCIRATDAGVIDIEYMVKSGYSKAKTRILAFKDGVRDYVSMLRPETFIDDTAKNIGDGLDTFVWHKVSWQATSDWGIDLAKVKVEILAKDMSEGLLSFRTVTIPAMNGHPKMIVCVDANLQLLDAIYWAYADAANGLRLENGKIYDGQTEIAEQFGPRAYNIQGAYAYIYGKMGYAMLSEADAAYVRGILRIYCYAGTPYKVVED